MTDDNKPDNATDPAQDPAQEPSPLSQVEKDLQEAKIAELTETAKRALADLQNFKRRTEEERAHLILFANSQFLQAIFPVIDNFKRAFDHIPEDLKNHDWVKGVAAIEKSFIDTLTALGLQEIPCEIGSPFDPNFHEVIMQSAGEKDAIQECLEKGYTFKEQVVRPAKVKVGDGSAK